MKKLNVVTARVVDGCITLAFIYFASLPIFYFARNAVARLAYPYELEWMEGGIVHHIRIVLEGGALYRAPSVEFTPFIYTPLYYYVAAAVSKVTGLGYFAPRLISVLSVGVILGVFIWWIWREYRDLVAGFAAASAFAATYALSSCWFDIARSDMFCLALVLLGYMGARFGQRRRAAVATGLILALAFFSKQQALALAFPPLVYVILRSPRRGIIAAATYALALGLGILILNVASHGWFVYYAFKLPSEHLVDWKSWRTVGRDALFTPVAPMALAVCALVGRVTLPSKTNWKVWAFYASWATITPLVSLASLLHTGGFPNVLIPAHAVMAMALGLAVASTRAHFAASEWSSAPRRYLALGVVCLQLALLSFGEVDTRPSLRDTMAGRAMMLQLKAMQKPIWMTTSAHFPYLAGQRETVGHAMGVVDVFNGKDPQLKQRLTREFRDKLRRKHFGAIVVDGAYGFLPPDITGEIGNYYRFDRALFDPSRQQDFLPKSGALVRPELVFVPK